MGWCGRTSSTNRAALSAILRAPQLGQKPRPSASDSHSRRSGSGKGQRGPLCPSFFRLGQGHYQPGNYLHVILPDLPLHLLETHSLSRVQAAPLGRSGEVVVTVNVAPRLQVSRSKASDTAHTTCPPLSLS